MYLMRDVFDSYSYDFFFISTVLIGAYFVFNLMIAVQFTYLIDSFAEDDLRKKKLLQKIKGKSKHENNGPSA